MKKTKLRLLLLLLFIGGLIILPQKTKAAEKAADIIPVNISVKYGQTEARTIFDMINEMRTNPYDTWCWDAYDNEKIPCPNLEELKYDYDLERVAMKRAAEIALSYEHERPMGGKVWDIYNEENIKWLAAGENISVGHTTAAEANLGWREDDEPYAGQGHRRNMLSSDYNCVGIGHVYYNGVHYWVEVFANRPEINTTEIPANDSTETVSVSVDKKKIKTVDVTFDQDAYSLRIGENITPIITETRIDVVNFSSQERGLAPVLDTPVVSIDDSSVASYNNNQLSGLKEGTTNLSATLYGMTASGSTVSVHDCKNHWDTGKVTKKVQIESRVLGDLAINHIVPTAVIYQNRLLENLRGLKEIFSTEEYEELTEDRKNLVREIQNRILAIKKAVHNMTEARKVANHLGSQVEKAFSYEEQVRPYLEEIRDHIDHLELEIDDEIWPLPKYRELLFTK